MQLREFLESTITPEDKERYSELLLYAAQVFQDPNKTDSILPSGF